MSSIKPLNGRILATRVEDVDVSAGGILIPTTAKATLMEADVVAIADGVEDVKVGQRAVFAKYAETTIEADGRKLLLIKVDDVLAVFDEEQYDEVDCGTLRDGVDLTKIEAALPPKTVEHRFTVDVLNLQEVTEVLETTSDRLTSVKAAKDRLYGVLEKVKAGTATPDDIDDALIQCSSASGEGEPVDDVAPVDTGAAALA